MVINNAFSDLPGVESGVPQGSALGPILFNLFINSIEDGISSSILVFADDTKLSRTIPSHREAGILQNAQEQNRRVGNYMANEV